MPSEVVEGAGGTVRTRSSCARVSGWSVFVGLIIGSVGGFAAANAIDSLVDDKTFCIRSRETEAELGGTEPGEVFGDGGSGCLPLDYAICVYAGSRRPVDGRCEP